MKKFVDFAQNGALAKSLDQVIGIESAPSAKEADIILTDSVNKVLNHLQQTDKKVIQICHSHLYPMTHLIEDYPKRFRVVDIRRSASILQPITSALESLAKE